MQKFYSSMAFFICLILGVQIFAQPGCVTYDFPSNGATDIPLSTSLQWTAPTSGDSPTMYHVFWGTSVPSMFEITATTNTSTPISSFVLGQQYFWRVDVESNGVITPACEVYSYTTVDVPFVPSINCGNATSIDYIFDFETNPDGWTGDIGTGTETSKWNFRTGQTPSPNTGPTGAYDQNQYIYFESSFATLDASIVSPSIDLTAAVGQVNLSFYMHAFGSAMDNLQVGVGTSQTGPFTNIWTWEGQMQSAMTSDWQLIGLDIDSYAGQIIYIEFKNVITDPTGGTADMSIDFVEVHACEFLLASNSDCETPATLASSGTPGTINNENTVNATASGIAAPSCNPVTGKDLFYSIETDVDGGALYIDVTSLSNSKYTIALYEGTCSNLILLDCETATATGSDVQLAYYASGFAGGGGNQSLVAPQNLIVRVYDENNADEAFSIAASGSALAALPVTLIEWKASLEKESVRLDWVTEQEINTDKFIIEKSRDGKNWVEIYDLKAAGFSSNRNTYQYQDFELFGLQYYRLKSIDFDGYFEYSNLIKIIRDDLSVETYPNPTNDRINISSKKFQQDVIQVSIYNSIGVMIKSVKLDINNLTIDVNELSSGYYSIIINDGELRYNSNFIKK